MMSPLESARTAESPGKKEEASGLLHHARHSTAFVFVSDGAINCKRIGSEPSTHVAGKQKSGPKPAPLAELLAKSADFEATTLQQELGELTHIRHIERVVGGPVRLFA